MSDNQIQSSLVVGTTAISPQDRSVFEELINEFLIYVKVEMQLRGETCAKYFQSLKRFLKTLSHISSPEQITQADITILKMKMMDRGVSESAINGILFPLRSFLNFCIQIHQLKVIDPKEIKPMSVPRKPVNYLSKEEIEKLFRSINTEGIRGLRTRTLMEVLFSTGARISEVLNLNRSDVDFEKGEAEVIGKGGRQRAVYFNDRAIYWLNLYFSRRVDNNPALFVTLGKAKRLRRYDLGKLFRRYAKEAGITKKVTPHVFRHTTGTIMLQNGGDIKFIQEVLGHVDIQTTARYYLGTDKAATKAAHKKFLHF